MSLIRTELSPAIDFGDPHIKAESTSAPKVIEFRHPAYTDEANALLELPALDNDSDGSRGIGIDYDFALAACGIIAGNRWSGSCFSLREPSTLQFVSVERPSDGLLRGGRYYFHPEGEHLSGKSEQPYPVVPSFDHWRYPHDTDLPTPWSTLNIEPDLDIPAAIGSRDAVLVRDTTCRVSGSSLELEFAHLVPSASRLWFELNKMSKYSPTSNSFASIDDYHNGIALRRDIHSLFDKRRFAIVPKSESAALVLHVLDGRQGREAFELRKIYHNILCQPITGVSRQFLFTRLAWTLFCDELFPLCRSPLHTFSVLLYDGTVRYGLDYKGVKVVANMLPMSGRSQSRSVSPTKRQRSEDKQTMATERQSCSADGQESTPDEVPRGRKRWRDGSMMGHSSKESTEHRFSRHNQPASSASPPPLSSANSSFEAESEKSPASVIPPDTSLGHVQLALDRMFENEQLDTHQVKRQRVCGPS